MTMDQRTQIIIIGVLILFLIVTYFRRKTSGSRKVDAVEGILKDVSENIAIMEEKLANPQSTRKFQIGNWIRFKDKIGFLESPELASVDEAFSLAGDFNARMNLARKNHAIATLQDMQVDKLREPLTKIRKGLSDWLRANRQQELDNIRRGGFGGLFRS